jgi:hypothetical protein
MYEFNVPSLQGFDLKPYVSFKTPKVSRDTLAQLKGLNDLTSPYAFNRYPPTPSRKNNRIINPNK